MSNKRTELPFNAEEKAHFLETMGAVLACYILEPGETLTFKIDDKGQSSWQKMGRIIK